MAGRLKQPGVEVHQIQDNRKPTVFRPTLVPCIFGVHKNIQYNLSLTYHQDGTTNSAVVIPTGNSNVVQQILTQADLSLYIETTRGLAPMTVTTHYTTSMDTALGVTNLVTIKDPINITKTLVATTAADSIANLSTSGTNYLVISDSDADFSEAAIQAGDVVVIDFDSSVKNTSSTFTGLTLSVTEVMDSTHLKTVWSNNNASWVDENGVSYSINSGTMSDVSGQVYISYTNGRVINDVNSIIEITSAEEAKEQFGELVPENPLGFHTLAALSGTDKSFYAMRVANEDLTSYETALDAAKNEEDIYHIVPATQSSAVHALCLAHVNYMSLPENKAERVMWINRNIPEYDTVQAIDGSHLTTFSSTGSATTVFDITDYPAADSAKLVPGVIWRPGQTTVLSTGQIVNNSDVRLTVIAASGTSLTLAGQVTTYGGATISGAVTGSFTTADYTKDSKAKYVAAIGLAYDNKRVRHVYPDVVSTVVTRTTQSAPTYEVSYVTETEDVDGTIACASLAAFSSAVAPSKPLTNEIVPGLSDLVGSNDELNFDHLDTIAGGGNWILIRTRGGALVTTRHQLTTAVSDVNTREASVVTAVDFAAKTFREYLRPLVGKSVITDSFINKVVRPTAHAAMHALIETGILAVGSAVLSIEQDPDEPTTIIIEVDVVPLYPANYFTVKIFV